MCFYGFCPKNFIACYSPSKRATELAPTIIEEIEKGNQFRSVSYSNPPQDTWTKPGYRAFESRISFANQIMEELADSNIYVIGIYGLPVVGKSTLTKQVARLAKEKLLLDVASIEVKQNADVETIQKQIAEKVGLKLDESMSISGRACSLSAYIKNKKNILVILDDVWELIDLENLGLPFGICKVLLTSRKRDLLSSEFGTQKEFLLEVLTKEETWSLFGNIVADDVKDLDIQEVAIEVAKRRAGLPIWVVTLAKALKGGNIHTWKEALRLQKRCEGKEMQEKAYSGIEWSYDRLEDEEVKSLFRICGMLGGDCFLDDLFKYTKGLGLSLFEGINTMEEARSRFHALVGKMTLVS
ncbi:disease resistance protein UNI-like [Ziziphus jujuba]|uniref:Disease resistance protein UNI-like n=1 Tax=Ziziphus jujuba TaxID=326968 RepID=A0ABM4AD16_ZIZJJ|nr:disease resistance protein UNI-like [Ziziphus jujuba]